MNPSSAVYFSVILSWLFILLFLPTQSDVECVFFDIKVVLEDDGLFPHSIGASHLNNVSYNFEIKIFIEMVYCVQLLLKSNIIQIWSFKLIFKINLI